MAITNLTGTKWLLNETFDYMPNGEYIWDSYGASDRYDINFSSNMTNYTKLGFYDGDWLDSSYSIWYYRYVGGSNYYDIGWQNEVWLDELYRTIEITGGIDTTNSDLIAWLQENATQIVSGYTISFNSNGGTAVSDIEEATELPTPLPTPTKSGSVFVGWYYDSDFTNEALAGDLLTADVTLYAKWYDLSIGKLYKGDSDVSNQYEKIYKGSELVYEKEEPSGFTFATVLLAGDYSRGATQMYYSLDDGVTWIPFSVDLSLTNVTTIKFKLGTAYDGDSLAIYLNSDWSNEIFNQASSGISDIITPNYTLTANTTYYFNIYYD